MCKQGVELGIIEQVRDSLQQIVLLETFRRIRIEDLIEVAGADDYAEVIDETDLAVNATAAMVEDVEAEELEGGQDPLDGMCEKK